MSKSDWPDLNVTDRQQTDRSHHHPFYLKASLSLGTFPDKKKNGIKHLDMMFWLYAYKYNIYVNIAMTETVSTSSVCTGQLILKTPPSSPYNGYICISQPPLRSLRCRAQVGRWLSGSSRRLISRAPGRLCSRGGWALLSHPAQVFSLPAWLSAEGRTHSPARAVHCFRLLGRNFIE